MHWTQTAKGKRKMAAVQRRVWRTKKAATLEHVRRNDEAATAPKKKAAVLAREEVARYARIGAETRLREIEREAERLRIFLGVKEE